MTVSEDIRVRGGDTTLVPHGYGTGASRVAVNTGNAVAVAAGSVRRKACRVAARLLECDEQDVRVENGQAFVIGAPMRALPLGRVARAAVRDRTLADLGGPGLWDTKFYALPTVTWASGVHVAVVEVAGYPRSCADPGACPSPLGGGGSGRRPPSGASCRHAR